MMHALDQVWDREEDDTDSDPKNFFIDRFYKRMMEQCLESARCCQVAENEEGMREWLAVAAQWAQADKLRDIWETIPG